MDFNYTEEQQMLRDSIGKYLEKSYDFDTRQRLVRSDAAWSEEAWQQFADFGLLALPFSEEQGGLGGSISDCVAFAELFGKHLVIEPYLAAVMLSGAARRRSSSDLLQCWIQLRVGGGLLYSVGRRLSLGLMCFTVAYA
jgi:alkylation response protein AidB-like acyl-CoA dehydrogenase